MGQAAAVSPIGRKARQATPERWQRALQRALFAGVEAKQIAGSGEWIVSSASRPGVCYRTDGIECDCEAAMLGGDPVCLHRAAYWYAQGLLDLDPEPDPPALGAVTCWACCGGGISYYRSGNTERCIVCGGTGTAPLAAQAAALAATASDGACDHCGEPLDEDARTDDSLETFCGVCVAAGREDALTARRAATSLAYAHMSTERAARAA